MASFLLRLLFCLGKRPRDPTIPDDRSRLIPASSVDEEALTGDAIDANARAAFDRAVFNERLANIVRSKEGKMVNVASPFPFNLHNKPRALLDVMAQGSYLSSSSRSASTSFFHEAQSPNPDFHRFAPAQRDARVRSGLQITPLNSAPPSRSRTRSRSHSRSSSASSRASLLQVDGEQPVLENDARPEPAPGVLGLRLVRRHNVGNGVSARRGRATVKKDIKEDEEVTSEVLEIVIDDVEVGDGSSGHSPTSPNTLLLENDQENGSALDAFVSRLLDVGPLTVSP